jgi:hypothetical protein
MDFVFLKVNIFYTFWLLIYVSPYLISCSFPFNRFHQNNVASRIELHRAEPENSGALCPVNRRVTNVIN